MDKYKISTEWREKEYPSPLFQDDVAVRAQLDFEAGFDAALLAKDSELKAKDEVINKLREALEFYGDKSNWQAAQRNGKYDTVLNDLETRAGEIGGHGGKLARSVLKDIGGEK